MKELTSREMIRWSNRLKLVLEKYSPEECLFTHYDAQLWIPEDKQEIVRAALDCARDTLKVCKTPRECVAAIDFLREQKPVTVSILRRWKAIWVPEEKLADVCVALSIALDHMTDRKEPQEILDAVRALMYMSDQRAADLRRLRPSHWHYPF